MRAALAPNSSFAVQEGTVNQKNFLVITLMLVAFAATSSALAQNSSSAKKDAAKSLTADDASKLNPTTSLNFYAKI